MSHLKSLSTDLASVLGKSLSPSPAERRRKSIEIYNAQNLNSELHIPVDAVAENLIPLPRDSATK